MLNKPAIAAQLNNASRTDIADEDAVLVKKAQNGDMDAFEELVKKYEGKVFSIASRMLAFSEDAKDAAQEAFLKAYRSLRGFRGDSKFSTWLYRITNNVCLDYLRKRDRRELPLDYETGGGDGETHTVDIPSDMDVEADVMGDEFRRIVQGAINSLPAQHRMMIVMRDVQELSYTEISGLLNLPEGTVKSRINRARKNLRTLFLGSKELKEYINV
ncbi:MAG: sigma-70 family RNA polymerase sigma factor [Oscillospiraceae bacterium]|nr:sigma-70 family RNA polymerase sigma factor [Oscillospiraceae bacterium]